MYPDSPCCKRLLWIRPGEYQAITVCVCLGGEGGGGVGGVAVLVQQRLLKVAGRLGVLFSKQSPHKPGAGRGHRQPADKHCEPVHKVLQS